MINNKQPPSPAYTAVNNAQQSIAQSTAIALGDATDNLRNLNTLSTTAIGVALSQYLENGDPKFKTVIEDAQSIVSRGADNFGKVGEQIAIVLHDEPEE
jgi:hypothetical protein